MADHSLDRQVGIDRLANDINTLKQQLSELRTLQQQGNDALNLQLSATASNSTSLANGASVAFTMTLTNASGKRLFGIPFVTLYEGSVAGGNEIGYGNARDASYRVVSIALDWGTTDNNNLITKVSITNNTGSTQTILFRGNWRFLVNAAT